MSESRNGHERRRAEGEVLDACGPGSSLVFGGFWALLLGGTLVVAGPFAGVHGILIGCAGLLMWLRPPVFALPRLWWILAATFVLAGAAAFLPAGWFAQPAWRQHLEALGVQTGPLVAIQARQAAEAFALFAIILFTGLWVAGHRPSPSQVRWWSLAFTLGVAAYAMVARHMQVVPQVDHSGGEVQFGFFPNRNHTATYLAMGVICGLGNVLQALRDKRFLGLAVALVGTGVCLWAVAAWSVSRGGVLLVATGCLIWLSLLGRRYLGRHGLWALALIGLAVVGLFFITDSRVKNRLSKTVEEAGIAINPADAATPGEGRPALEAIRSLDARIPIMLDTLGLIRDFKWTGIGAGQYYHVFPQYRNLTAVANDVDSFHPESDWLWMAAEVGVPATLALAVLVILAFWKSLLVILGGRDRAVRSACLVAALLVPLHGCFDVPGHRITLAWSAAFLFALARHVPPTQALPSVPRAWPFRLAALILLAVSGLLFSAQWWGGPQLALTSAKGALQQARRLCREDQALQQAALAAGQVYQPDPAEDRLEKALVILRQTAPVAPLDRSILRYQGFLAMHFDDKYELADRTFAAVRALEPSRVAAPLWQAEAWAPVDPQRSADLWTEALRRAKRLDRLQPHSRWSSEQTLLEIRQIANGKPELEKFLPLPD